MENWDTALMVKSMYFLTLGISVVLYFISTFHFLFISALQVFFILTFYFLFISALQVFGSAQEGRYSGGHACFWVSSY